MATIDYEAKFKADFPKQYAEWSKKNSTTGKGGFKNMAERQSYYKSGYDAYKKAHSSLPTGTPGSDSAPRARPNKNTNPGEHKESSYDPSSSTKSTDGKGSIGHPPAKSGTTPAVPWKKPSYSGMTKAELAAYKKKLAEKKKSPDYHKKTGR